LPAACIAVLALIPRALTAGRFQTNDEVLWMERSRAFSEALLHFNPAAASATTGVLSTMPGVTTMWLGTAARLAWSLAVSLGLVDGHAPFTASPAALHLAQLSVAAMTSALIGLLALLAWQWASPVVAVSAGVVLASEPFVIAHGAVLHTDALTALFGAAGALALLLALGIPAPATRRPYVLAGLGGALLGAALLTKLSALLLVPGLAVVVGGAMARRWQRGRTLRQPATLLTVASGVAFATFLTWPAIWADTARQLALLQQSAALIRTPHPTFFLGVITATPGPLFYAVAIPLRMTPWFLLGSLFLIPLAPLRGRRHHTVILLVITLPVVVVLSAASKQMDRYALTALPFVALAVGCGVEVLVATASRWFGARPRLALAAGLAAVALLTMHAVAIAPWHLAYFNPLLGGATTAEHAILVGWGEGLELAGERIRRREAPHCNVKIALMYSSLASAFPCGSLTADVTGADYFVLYINHRQRLGEQDLTSLRERGRLVDVVSIRGIDYAEIYDLRGVSDNAALQPVGVADGVQPPR
jgi:hypothetical protein